MRNVQEPKSHTACTCSCKGAENRTARIVPGPKMTNVVVVVVVVVAVGKDEAASNGTEGMEGARQARALAPGTSFVHARKQLQLYVHVMHFLHIQMCAPVYIRRGR